MQGVKKFGILTYLPIFNVEIFRQNFSLKHQFFDASCVYKNIKTKVHVEVRVDKYNDLRQTQYLFVLKFKEKT